MTENLITKLHVDTCLEIFYVESKSLEGVHALQKSIWFDLPASGG